MGITKSPVHIVSSFWGLMIDGKLSWQCHIDQMIPKLNKASYVIRFCKPLLSLELLKMVGAFFNISFHSDIWYNILGYIIL